LLKHQSAVPLELGVQADSRMRSSNGLDQFFSAIQGESNLSILDLGGASQANISFITSLGYRLSSEDILYSLDDCFGSGSDSLRNQSDAIRVGQFFEQSLDFPDSHFDGALIWDTLQFMTPSLLDQTVKRLSRILRPSSCLLAFFNADERAASIPVHSYRILDEKTLRLVSRGERAPAQFFNNRSLEKIFQNFQSVKFFLTRDHLREVIVKR
jgi:hypothetical protein